MDAFPSRTWALATLPMLSNDGAVLPLTLTYHPQTR